MLITLAPGPQKRHTVSGNSAPCLDPGQKQLTTQLCFGLLGPHQQILGNFAD